MLIYYIIILLIIVFINLKLINKFSIYSKILVSILLILTANTCVLVLDDINESKNKLKNEIKFCDSQIQILTDRMLNKQCYENYEFKYGKRFILNNERYSITKLEQISYQCRLTFNSLVTHMINKGCYDYYSIEWDNKEKYEQAFNEVINE